MPADPDTSVRIPRRPLGLYNNGRVKAVPVAPEDRAILELESSTVVGHTCKVIVLGGDAPDLSALRARIAGRIESAPPLTRRLAATPEGLAWVPDGGFDIASHVVSVPGEPIDRSALQHVVARLFAQRLDRARPLWRIDVVPVRGGGAALVWRVHHALADGTTAMRYARTLLWDSPPRGVGAERRKATSPPDDDVRRRGHLIGFLRREFPHTGERSPFDGHIGAGREIAFASTQLEDLHHAAKTLCGATLNDAVLTAVAGGLRRWLHSRHGHLGVVRVKVPVSLHHQGDDAANRDSFFTVGLPLGEPDPVARLYATHSATVVRQQEHDAATMDELLRHLAGISPSLARWCARIEQSPRGFAVNVSNVPGPRSRVGVLDAPVDELYTIAEIGERHALRVAVISLGDTLSFGLCADPTIVHNVQVMAEGIETEARALSAAAPR